MSDEESFVILGSCSPGNSLRPTESLRNDFRSLEISKIEKKITDEKQPIEIDDKTNDHDDDDDDDGNVVDSTNEKENAQKSHWDVSYDGLEPVSANGEVSQAEPETLAEDNATSVINECLDKSFENTQNTPLQTTTTTTTTPMTRSNGSGGSTDDGSLAASFIMGEVKAEVLKSSVYSQFPSLSVEACPEDVAKLQNFMTEYIGLKGALAKVNATMKVYYDSIQHWRDEMLCKEQKYEQQIQHFQTQIAMLRNENLELKRDIEAKLDLMKIDDELKRNETAELVQKISEKTALVQNLRSQIDNLESPSLVFISKAGNDSAPSSEYIVRSEHMLAMKEMDNKLSQLLTENLELKDMQKIYIDEINCLKVNLTAAEELHQQSRRDINLLKAKDMEKSELFSRYEDERDKMREEISLLRQQVDVYFKDFQMERAARESLAGEKDKLLQDIRAIQRANQQLIEDQKRHLDTACTSASSNTSTVINSEGNDNNNASKQALPKVSSSNIFRCPVCGNAFQSLTILQSHVNNCLDNS